MNRTARGTVVALGVAALFSAGTAFAESASDGHDMQGGGAKTDAKVACTGVNECKGKGECAGAGNSCAGSNSCKGKGVQMMSAADCQKKGGKVVAN